MSDDCVCCRCIDKDWICIRHSADLSEVSETVM